MREEVRMTGQAPQVKEQCGDVAFSVRVYDHHLHMSRHSLSEELGRVKHNYGGRACDRTSRITLTPRLTMTAEEPLLFEQKHQLLVSLRLSRYPLT